MNENKLLVGILIVLAVSVLATGGFTAYLALSHAQEGNATAETSTEQVLQDSLLAEQTDTDTALAEPRIAYVSDHEGDALIYTVRIDGSDRQRISAPDQGFCLYPSWSPDGQHVAYIGAEERPFDTNDVPVAIWVSAADGSKHIRASHVISDAFFTQPSWSPDGTLLAFASQSDTSADDSATIHIARADGSGIKRNIAFPRPIELLIWSPTKDKLLIVSGSPRDGDRMVVHVMSIDGSEITEVFQGSVTADWTPDGESVVVGDFTAQEVLAIDLSQGDQEQTARPIAQTVMQPVEIAWSPSGTHVAVATTGHYRQGYATVLHVATVESGEVATVAEGDGWVGWPRWSPDGQSLMFTWGELSRRVGLPLADLWVYDIASGQLEPRTTDAGFEGLGAWSP